MSSVCPLSLRWPTFIMTRLTQCRTSVVPSDFALCLPSPIDRSTGAVQTGWINGLHFPLVPAYTTTNLQRSARRLSLACLSLLTLRKHTLYNTNHTLVSVCPQGAHHKSKYKRIQYASLKEKIHLQLAKTSIPVSGFANWDKTKIWVKTRKQTALLSVFAECCCALERTVSSLTKKGFPVRNSACLLAGSYIFATVSLIV
jgi:hypothetical protein